jgi:hypothetical protein
MEQQTQGNVSAASGLRQLGGVRRKAPALFYGLVFLLAAELVAVVAGPMVIPNYVYLRLYLGKKARESTARLLADRDQFLMYDPVVGWRNRPNADRGNWRTDSLGSRSTHPFGLERLKPTRVLFLGSSLTNGGMGVAANETISAYVEDSTTEAINFGTMLYSLDQMYLAYSSELYRYNANVIVVGLSGDPADGLTNRYIPFRNRSETNLPFLKPRLLVIDTGVTLISVPPRQIYSQMLQAGDILDSLRSTDTYYGKFAQFSHFGLTPLSSGMWYLFEKARNLVRLVTEVDSTPLLSIVLMKRLEDEARSHGASVVFMLLADQSLTYPSAWRSRLPDQYGRTVEELRRRGFTLLDGRHVLWLADRTPWQVYGPDAAHFTAAGNRLIGQALQRLLKSSAVYRSKGTR